MVKIREQIAVSLVDEMDRMAEGSSMGGMFIEAPRTQADRDREKQWEESLTPDKRQELYELAVRGEVEMFLRQSQAIGRHDLTFEVIREKWEGHQLDYLHENITKVWCQLVDQNRMNALGQAVVVLRKEAVDDLWREALGEV